MKKKIIALLLAFACLLSTLSACGESSSKGDKDPQTGDEDFSAAYTDSSPIAEQMTQQEQEAMAAPPQPGVITGENEGSESSDPTEDTQPEQGTNGEDTPSDPVPEQPVEDTPADPVPEQPKEDAPADPVPEQPKEEVPADPVPADKPVEPSKEPEQPPVQETPPAQEQPPVQEQPQKPSDTVHTNVLVPEASGILTVSGSGAEIDYSNTDDGYVMVRYTGGSTAKLKVLVKGPTTTYTYTLPKNSWTVFPLSDGNGYYQVTAYENIVDNKYATLQSASFFATMTDEFTAFLRPNQYVNFDGAVNTIAKAEELCRGIDQPLDMVKAVYNYVVTNLKYDRVKAATVKSGYLPDLDKVLSTKRGICFDYAALMAGMLRSQGVPCKLVVGYAGTAYHAWISVWTEESGWVEGAIFFDGNTWHRMDPTFASSGKQSQSIMEYIGNGANYTAKYLY